MVSMSLVILVTNSNSLKSKLTYKFRLLLLHRLRYQAKGVSRNLKVNPADSVYQVTIHTLHVF